MPVLPLDELQVTEKDPVSGKSRTLPALHPERASSRHFVTYVSPPSSSGLLEEFLERAEFIKQDLQWLLALPHDLFWCQVIFDESLQKCLDSYLSNAPRKYDSNPPLPPTVQQVQNELHRCVFLTFLRMSTHKESKEHHITPSVFGEILYNNYLFDIPKLMDICVLFGKGNSALLQKMIGNIFQHQPSYYEDLGNSVPTLLQVFNNILEICGLQMDGDKAEPQKLGDQRKTTPLDMAEEELQDVLLYLCDTSSTLWAFLDIFPAASQTLQKHGFLNRLSSFYELCCPELEDAITKRKFEDKGLQAGLWSRLSHSRKKMLEICHTILSNSCLQPILEHRADNIQPYVEEFLEILTSLLPERRFLCDYDELFPVAEDVSLLRQVSPSLDETRTTYILHGVQGSWADSRRPRPCLAPPHTGKVTEGAYAGAHQNSQSIKEPECEGAAAYTHLTDVELDSLVSQVKDLLPDFGEGFILSCLEEYGNDPEKVINNLLEENLTPRLQELDRTMPRQQKPEPCPLVSSRSNIYADDEFDVFSRDVVDASRIWKGRRKQETSAQLLADKSVIAGQKERYSRYAMVTEEHIVDGDYDDEYDDTYDGNQVGANDADSDDELISRRPFTTPQVLRLREEAAVEEDEEEEAEEETVKPDHFVQDPAVLRERAEARRASYYARKGIRHDNSSALLGANRGQGQSRDTLQERRKKEANKGVRANHNRRAMADRKRNKGMIPS
ncbi:activating signal cointegrator 1 complex subunit 2 [Spea bombifrons]|uniref:activating signal cointegrator 1 complex subunit 2 n=1 Tax=Spea bombifrons TaxID=233779 RepID=UPI00234BDD18|nr:activating signal cointegrator 1 complex subunit 2 [Spea bombifrons]XP_053324532.1 activating signal cointegrator 1 complex subunit 2 [Spea bombifrons]